MFVELNRAASNSDPNLVHGAESEETLATQGEQDEARIRSPYGNTQLSVCLSVCLCACVSVCEHATVYNF